MSLEKRPLGRSGMSAAPLALGGNVFGWTADEKASFAVKFDAFAKDQEYHGLTKLMFNNSVQDPTYVVEWLATGLFRDAELPAARVTHARVTLNGQDLGASLSTTKSAWS